MLHVILAWIIRHRSINLGGRVGKLPDKPQINPLNRNPENRIDAKSGGLSSLLLDKPKGILSPKVYKPYTACSPPFPPLRVI